MDDPSRAGQGDAAVPPGGLLLRRRRRGARQPGLRGHAQRRAPAHPRHARRRRRAGHRASLRPEVGGDHQRAHSPPLRSRAGRHRGVRARRRRPDRPRRDRAGEVRKQPQRPPVPLRDRGLELHRPGLRALPVGPVVGAGRARERVKRRAREGRPPRPRPSGLLLPHRDAGAPQRRPGDRPHLPQRIAAAGAPRRGHRARRRPRRGARRLRPVRRRLHRRARQRVAVAQPRLLGRAAGLRRGADRDRLAGPLRPGLGRAEGGRRGAAADAGARRLGRPVEARRRPPRRAGRARSRAPPHGLARHFPHQKDYIEALRDDLRAWVDSGFAKPDFVRSIEAFRPERDRRDGIEHLVVFPMYKQNALARHLLRGADRARPLAGLRRRAGALRLRQPQVRPGQLRRLHRRLRLRVRGAVPRDRSPPPSARRATSAASSATARRSASAASAAPPPSSWASTCRPTPPAC